MDTIKYLMVIFISLLYLLLIVRTTLLIIQGIKPFVIGKGKQGLKGIMEILFSIGLIIWSLEIVFHSLKINFHFLPSIFNMYILDLLVLKIIGIILIFFGIIIFTLSLISFGKSWRVGIDKENAGKLITSGIFSITRNPIFLFIDIYFIGTFLVYSNLFFLLLMFITIIGIHFQIIQEEIFLLSHYGDEYKNYLEKVRRYI